MVAAPNRPDRILAETRYWRSLTDEQLLETAFRADDPVSLDRIVQELPQTDEIPFVEFAYNTKAGSGLRVRCIHCRWENHNRGFVLRFRDGTRILVGKDCGKKIYGADFDLIEKDFDAAKDRAYYLRRRRAAIEAARTFRAKLAALQRDPALEQFRTAKVAFNRAMPNLARALASACRQDAGALYVEAPVRDFEAEARREEQQEVLAQRIGAMTKTAIKKARDAGLLRRPGDKPKPIYKYVPKLSATIAGQAFFLADREFPHVVIDNLAERVLQILDVLTSGNMSTPQLRVVFRDFDGILADLLAEIDRLVQLTYAFEVGNLSRIAEWATTALGDNATYTAGVGSLFRANRLEQKTMSVTLPPEYRAPSSRPFEELRLAIQPAPDLRRPAG
jgi:transcriptional regulator NrdR family protein